MELTIGICDDSPEQNQLLKLYLDRFQGSEVFAVFEATNPQEFLIQLEAKQPQLVFLDIDMGEMNGIQLGEKIKELYEDTIIIYISAHEKYALEAFQIRAFHYLLKPLTKEKFKQVLEEAMRLIKKESENKPLKTFTVQIKGEFIRLNYSDIYYFEKIGHKIRIHTENRDIYYYDNFYNLLEKIESSSFIQCHQGYIANVDKIIGFRDKTLFLDGTLKLPVSRSFVENIKEILAQRLFTGKALQ